jgi:hypothetical protein
MSRRYRRCGSNIPHAIGMGGLVHRRSGCEQVGEAECPLHAEGGVSSARPYAALFVGGENTVIARRDSCLELDRGATMTFPGVTAALRSGN